MLRLARCPCCRRPLHDKGCLSRRCRKVGFSGRAESLATVLHVLPAGATSNHAGSQNRSRGAASCVGARSFPTHPRPAPLHFTCFSALLPPLPAVFPAPWPRLPAPLCPTISHLSCPLTPSLPLLHPLCSFTLQEQVDEFCSPAKPRRSLQDEMWKKPNERPSSRLLSRHCRQ